MSKLINILKTLRTDRNLSIKELAIQLNMDYTLYSRFENGSRIPNKEHIIKIASFYNIALNELLVVWLSEKIYNEIKDEEIGLQALQLAESKVAYGKKTFVNHSLIEEINELKQQLDNIRPLSKSHIKKLFEYYKIEYTYDSNRIEGNTLTLQETALVVEKGLTISGKSVQEHFEAVNHAEAIDLLYDFVEANSAITEHLIKQVHHLILRGIDKENAGRYRSVNVKISGSKHLPPEPYLLNKLMEDYIIFYDENCNKLHPVILAAEMHERLVTIHPFIDGNGRTSRLIMNLILLQAGYPITNISSERDNRLAYYKALEDVQVNKDKKPFYEFVASSTIKSLRDFIKMAE